MSCEIIEFATAAKTVREGAAGLFHLGSNGAKESQTSAAGNRDRQERADKGRA